MAGPAETARTLWVLTFGPVIWAAHFMLCYVAAAIYCAKAPQAGHFDTLRLALVGLSVLALAGIAATAARAYRWHRSGAPASRPHDADTARDRHRFIGFATLLLCGLSAVAIVYVTMVVMFFEDCR